MGEKSNISENNYLIANYYSFYENINACWQHGS